jgi:tryptophan 7-halogenase
MKKLAMIGRGTAGCMSAGAMLHYTDYNIDWYFDSSIKPQPVGEGAFAGFSTQLYEIFNFTYGDLPLVDGTIKTGQKKIGFSKNPVLNYFPPPHVGYHFNALKLQDYIVNKLSLDNRINIIDKNVTADDIDADFVMDCSGRPTNFDDHTLTDSIPVNSAYVTQCFWDHPTFSETLNIASPHGWVFCVPLQNRCAVGYLYNKDINTLDDIKDDVKNIFEEYQLTPSDQTSHFTWKNYYRKENFTDRVVYNGSASMFLEPLETTPLWLSTQVQNMAIDLWNKKVTAKNLNTFYIQLVKEIETIILLHYYSSTKYNTKFWNHARLIAEKHFLSKENDPDFKNILKIINPKHSPFLINYGIWDYLFLKFNLQSLDLYPRLSNLMK